MQSALREGIDAEAARRSAQVTLSRAIENGHSLGESMDDILADDPILQRYVEHQRNLHRSVLASLASRAAGALAMHVDTEQRTSKVTEAMDASSLFAMIMPVPAFLEATSDGHADFPSVSSDDNKLEYEALVRVGEQADSDGAGLVRTLKLLVDAGWHGVTVSHFGSMGPPELRSVKQAVRFARRSATD
jgi:hypothetical protein